MMRMFWTKAELLDEISFAFLSGCSNHIAAVPSSFQYCARLQASASISSSVPSTSSLCTVHENVPTEPVTGEVRCSVGSRVEASLP